MAFSKGHFLFHESGHSCCHLLLLLEFLECFHAFLFDSFRGFSVALDVHGVEKNVRIIRLHECFIKVVVCRYLLFSIIDEVTDFHLIRVAF